MPAVSIEDRFTRATRAVGFALAWAAEPKSDQEHELVQETLKTALALSVEVEVLRELLDGVHRGSQHLGFEEWMRSCLPRYHGPGAYGLKLRLRERWAKMLRLTKDLGKGTLWSIYYTPRHILAIEEIVDVAFEAAARLDELRDTEIVTRSLTTAT